MRTSGFDIQDGFWNELFETKLCKHKEHSDEIFGWSPLGVINANTIFA
jgi:hypothetical protein